LNLPVFRQLVGRFQPTGGCGGACVNPVGVA
jgi:hypothetical protein